MSKVSPRIAVYTCITGGYDTLKTPTVVSPTVDYYCFTDNPEMVRPPWIPMPITTAYGSKNNNRFIKMHPDVVLPGYSFSIYVDGTIQIVGDVEDFRRNLPPSNADMLVYRHPLRDCVYEEAAACCHYSHEWFWIVAKQMRRYAKAGIRQHGGLFECGVIARYHTSRMRTAMDVWWAEYLSGAKRDQLALPYVMHAVDGVVGSLGESDHRIVHNYFLFIPHQKSIFHPIATFRKYVNRLAAGALGYGRLFGVAAVEFKHSEMPSSWAARH